MAAQIDGDFVVFLIGMRINKPWKVHKWWPVFMAMPAMLKELQAGGPSTGFLGYYSLGLKALIQYWRSFDHLEAYARSQDHKHWPAWGPSTKLSRTVEAMSAFGMKPIWCKPANMKRSTPACRPSG